MAPLLSETPVVSRDRLRKTDELAPGTLVASGFNIHNKNQQEMQPVCMVLLYIHCAKLGTN
jgi:hypothetical protein